MSSSSLATASSGGGALETFVCDEKLSKLFPLKGISDVVQLFKVHLECAKEPDLTLLSIVTGIIENTLTSKSNTIANVASVDSSTLNNNNAEPTNNNSTTDDMIETKVKSDESKHVNDTSDAGGVTNFPVVTLDKVKNLYEKFMKIVSIVGPCKRVGGVTNTGDGKKSSGRSNGSATSQQFATREIIKHVSDVIWNSLIRSTYKDRAHLQSLYSYLADNKLDCFGVALATVAGCQQLGYEDTHLAISEDHAWVVFGKTGEETIEVTWHGKGAEDKRGQSVTQGYESHSWLYLSGYPVVCDRYIEVGAIVSSINPSLSMTSACLEVAELQQQLLWLLYDTKHLQRYPMGLGCLGELEEVAATEGRLSCKELYQAAVEAAQNHYKNHHVYPYTYQGGFFYRQKQYKDAFASWANASDVIRLYNYSRDDEEIYKEFLDIANELIPHVMKMESSGHSAKSILRDPQCFANLLRFYDGICLWEQGSLTPILHIGWVKPLVTTISRFDGEIRSQVIIHCAKDEDDVNEVNNALHTEHNNNDVSATLNQEIDAKNADKKANSDTIEASIEPDPVRTTLVEALTAACGENILNPDFLLQGGGKPFAEDSQQAKSERSVESEKQLLLLASSPRRTDEPLANEKSPSHATDSKPHEIDMIDAHSGESDAKKLIPSTGPVFKETAEDDIIIPKRPEITLYSQKMKGLKDLLLAEKLNTHAISLQLTAQSQVQVGGKKSRSSIGAINYAVGTKRSRRE